MELKIKKSTLLESLVKLSGFENIVVEATDTLTMSSSNDQTTTQIIVDSEIKKEGSACVSFQKLLNFAKNYSADDIKIKTTPAGWVNVEGKHVKVRLPGLHKDNYPNISFKESDNLINIDSSELRKAIALTLPSVGQNKARESLTGLHVKIDGKKATVTGGDGHTASRCYIDCDSEDCELLLTQKTAADIEKLLDETCVIKRNDNTIMIESESMRYKSVLMGAQYPNVDRIVEHQGANLIKVKKAELLDNIGILTSVVSATKDPIVKLVFENNVLSIESPKLDTGDGDATVECDYSGEQLKIGANIEMLKKNLATFKSTDNDYVSFGISGPELPIIITDSTIDNFRSVVMPVRIKW